MQALRENQGLYLVQRATADQIAAASSSFLPPDEQQGIDQFTLVSEPRIAEPDGIAEGHPDAENVRKWAKDKTPYVLKYDAKGILAATSNGAVIFFSGERGMAVFGSRDDWPEDPAARAELEELCEELTARNKRLGLLIQVGGEDATEGELKPTPLPALKNVMTLATSQLEQGIAYNLSCIRKWDLSTNGRRREHEVTGKNRRFRVGLSAETDAWEKLKNRPLRTMKMWIALEARRYEGTHPLDPFCITPERLARDMNCDDRGYVSPAIKEEIAAELDALIRVEGTFSYYNSKNEVQRLRAPVFHRKRTVEVSDDLFGFIPQAIVLQRNSDLYGEDAVEFLRRNDKAPRALLEVNLKTNPVAFVLGFYILNKARSQTHNWAAGEARFRNTTLIQALRDADVIGTIESYQKARNEHKIRQIVEKALEKLVEIGFLTGWGDAAAQAQSDSDLESADDILRAFPPEKRKKGAFMAWLTGTTALYLSKDSTALQEKSRQTKAKAIAQGPKAKRSRKPREAQPSE